MDHSMDHSMDHNGPYYHKISPKIRLGQLYHQTKMTTKDADINYEIESIV